MLPSLPSICFRAQIAPSERLLIYKVFSEI
jgi:hypothetical protein